MFLRWFLDEDEEEEGDVGRDDTDNDHPAVGIGLQVDHVPLKQENDPRRQQQPERGTGCIHSFVKTIGLTAVILVHRIADQSITRGRADAFTDAVGKPDGHNGSPGMGDEHKRLGQCGKRIAEEGKVFSVTQSVAQPAAEELEQRSGAFRHTLNQADDDGSGAQHISQEKGHEREDHLAGNVRQETYKANKDNVGGEAEQFFLFIQNHFPSSIVIVNLANGLIL